MDMSPTQKRHQLLRANTEKIELLYEQSIKDGMAEPVIFVLDVHDEDAQRIAVGLTGEADVATRIAEVGENPIDLCLLQPIAREEAIQWAETNQLRSVGLLRECLAGGCFYVIVVSCGGVSVTWRRNP